MYIQLRIIEDTRIRTRNYEYNQTIYNINKVSLNFRLDESFICINYLNRNVFDHAY